MIGLEEIKRLIEAGISNKRISESLGCSRKRIAAVRNKTLNNETIKSKEHEGKNIAWIHQVNWDNVERDLVKKFCLRMIWEEQALTVTSYSSFYRYTKKRFKEHYRKHINIRQFNPGEYCEVDYAGDKVKWFDKDAKTHEASIFVGILCFSQKIFAWAAENEKLNNWILSNRKMIEYFGGAPKVLRPDNLKAATTKAHRYDPDLNPNYVAFAVHYCMTIVPARTKKPQDKALVENSVGLLQRYFAFVSKNIRFTTIDHINEVLKQCVEKINAKPHTRFKISRNMRFLELEKNTLTPLPLEPYQGVYWMNVTVRPNGTITIEKNDYTVPYPLSGEMVKVRITFTMLEVFYEQRRVAMHLLPKNRAQGELIINHNHLTEEGRAFLECEPEKLISQAKFLNKDLECLIRELLEKNRLGNLRKAEGMINVVRKTLKIYPDETKSVSEAIEQLKMYPKKSVDQLNILLKNCLKKMVVGPEREIIRQPGNPTLRIIPAETKKTSL